MEFTYRFTRYTRWNHMKLTNLYPKKAGDIFLADGPSSWWILLVDWCEKMVCPTNCLCIPELGVPHSETTWFLIAAKARDFVELIMTICCFNPQFSFPIASLFFQGPLKFAFVPDLASWKGQHSVGTVETSINPSNPIPRSPWYPNWYHISTEKFGPR